MSKAISKQVKISKYFRILKRADALQESIDYQKEQTILLRKMVKDPSPEEALLLSHDIIPLRNSKGQSFLGKGLNGSVFRAVFDGKQVAVKITDVPNELTIWRKILEMKHNLGEEVSRHLPTIHKLFTAPTEDGRNLGIVVMELLSPLHKDMEKTLFGQEFDLGVPIRRMTVGKLLGDHELIFNAIKQILTDSFPAANEEDTNLEKKLPQILMKELSKFAPPDTTNIKARYPWEDAFANQQRTVVVELSKFIFDRLVETSNGIDGKGLTPILISKLSNELSNYLFNLAVSGNFPIDAPNDEEGAHKHLKDLPEAKSLYAALQKMKANGIYWADLHYGNLMMRPSTGDLVIIDVGSYYLIN